MRNVLARLALGFAALGLIAGGLIHASPFVGVATMLDDTAIRPFMKDAFKALWLEDSLVLILLGLAASAMAARLVRADAAVLILLGLMPIGTSVLVYHFIGNFFGGHMVLACGLLIVAAAFLFTKEPPAQLTSTGGPPLEFD